MKQRDLQVIKQYGLNLKEVEYYIEKMGFRVEHNGMNENEAITLTLGEIQNDRAQ
jgi:hypothetical protein